MPLLSNIGEATTDGVAYVGSLARLAGGTARAVFIEPFRGHPLRWGRAVHQAMSVGVEAIPIVSLISFFIGLILALQGAYELRQLGALQLVASAVAVTMTRELGPLMTAVMVIGRSGSAFAAEIGTMKVNEEIDALETMALEPVRFLVAPKFLAMLLMMPCLTTWADFMGVLGGGVFGVIERRLHLGHLYSCHAECSGAARHPERLDQERDVRTGDHGRGMPRRIQHGSRFRTGRALHHLGSREFDFLRDRCGLGLHGDLLFHGAA